MDDSVLEDAGLTHNEIKVYKALLEAGSVTAGPLTKRSGIHRSRVYEALDRLVEKGIVSYKLKGNRKYFSAQNPETLIEFIEEKKRKVQGIIPELMALQAMKPEKQEANVFEGYKGLKSVFENALNELKKGDEMVVFGASGGMYSAPETWKAFFKNYNARRIKKGVKQSIIFNEDVRRTAVAEEYEKSPLVRIRYSGQATPAGINIHGDKVAIVLWKKKPYAFVITSREVSESFRTYFKELWKQAKA